jgi:dipeptidase E
VRNPSIRDALVDMLGQPIEESTALCVPTAVHALPGGPAMAWRLFLGQASTPLYEIGWKSVGVLELTALPSLAKDSWVPAVQEADVLLVGGGDVMYLVHWMRESGFAELLPTLGDKVYVGVSAGSLAMCPKVGEDFVHWRPPTGGDEGLGLVDFSIFPHVDHPALPDNSMAGAERWAATLPVPGYAIDDETAIRVMDRRVEVISEGHWKLFSPPAERSAAR